ncbi:hypothetical protein [Pelagicoccus albus]|uniref:Helix-turn-helix domain-containing protein n=1 Tax=Pelagicoccus albus TaxID=415222 RepID=A0A7X1E9B6_9BACT|nr:hypothetical protein [Pelagicoccus albus]MBC2605617.1 hypothetical protein [Pelagicoccus albus]
MSGRNKLVDGSGLLETLFDEHSRPSLKWLSRMRSSGVIPSLKVGRLVRYDPLKVKQALARIQAAK